MKYFVQEEVKLLRAPELEEWAKNNKNKKVAVQVAKNNFETGREISKALQRNEIETHILADSDRCCLDWVAIAHSTPECIIKRSFSCPLLNLSKSNKLSKKYPVHQYIPEGKVLLRAQADIETNEIREILSKYRIFLAVDILCMESYAILKEYLETILGKEVEQWEYQQEHSENVLILVLSENEGFSLYFSENYNSILLNKEMLSDTCTTVKKLIQVESELSIRRTKLLISKMALVDTLKSAKRIGIVFTSADHMELINVIAKYLDMHNKKFYQFFVNGLKPNKLGNFVGIDVFIVIQCPFSSFCFESNILALRPYDLLLAFREDWDGKYSTNLEVAYRDLISEIKRRPAIEECTEIAVLQIKNSINTLKLARNEVCTKEQAQKYFQTGEYMKKVEGITIAETVSEEPTDALVEGYSGIPTEYKSKLDKNM